MEPMPCRELVEVVTDYLEAALPEPDRRRFEAHLAVCPPCREYVAQLRRTVDTLGRIEPEALSEDARAGLVRAFRGWRDAAWG